jgi:hypothetical protein
VVENCQASVNRQPAIEVNAQAGLDAENVGDQGTNLSVGAAVTTLEPELQTAADTGVLVDGVPDTEVKTQAGTDAVNVSGRQELRVTSSARSRRSRTAV